MLKFLFALQMTLFSTLSSLAQMDTITLHSLVLKGEGKKFQYYVDGKLSTKAVDLEAINSFGKCTPCWLKVIDKNGKLNYEGNFWTDCCIGSYIEWYDNGQIKVRGQYNAPAKGEEPDFNKGFCKREGLWTYYKRNGGVIRTETYKDGHL
jgi:antitoxin component YwqK of YwqJK toxin-antitoxin module